jgi:NitT/TauT family transport system ATP-binding protein
MTGTPIAAQSPAGSSQQLAPAAPIEAHDLALTYRGVDGSTVMALQKVSFTIARGEFVSLIGPSGCGKTTLLKLFGDLLNPSSGSLMVSGRTPAELRKARQVGTMFQDATLLPWKTIRDNIRLLSLIADRPISDARVQELADLVGIGGFLDRYPHELSGGMRQRAALARAYALDPEILLMDEPFGALDEITRERMNDELLRIWEKRKQTVIFVTHGIAEAAFLSDRVFVMAPRPGRIVADVRIDLPRPRRSDMRFGTTMTAYTEEIHRRLVAGMAADEGGDHGKL